MPYEEVNKSIGCISENPASSLVEEVAGHLRNTWSNVFSGKASAQEYAEVALEVTLAAAATGLAMRQGLKFLSARSSFAAAETQGGMRFVQRAGLSNAVADSTLLDKIRLAAHGDLSKAKLIPLGPDGIAIADFSHVSVPRFGIGNLPPSKLSIGEGFRFEPSAGLSNTIADSKALDKIRQAARGDLPKERKLFALRPDGFPY